MSGQTSSSGLPWPEGDTAGTMRFVQDVDGAPDEVWGCLTDPNCFRRWWANHIDFEAPATGRFAEPWQDPTGRGRRIRAQVTAFHPPRGLGMVWADEGWTFDTVVAVSLEPAGEGTRVTVEHQGWHLAPDLARAGLWNEHQDGWARHLASLAAHAKETNARRKGH